jgi:hypothetical protein
VTPLTPFTSTTKPLQLVAADPKLAGPLTATIARSPGGGSMVMNLPGLQGVLNGGARKGQIDQVTVDPKTDVLGYQTNGAGASLVGSLVAAPGAAAGASASRAGASAAASALSDHVVGLRMTTGGGRSDRLSFAQGRELVIRHSGPATSVSLTLSAFASNGQPVAVQLPSIRLAGGATLHVAPASWRALTSSMVRARTTGRGRAKVTFLRGRTLGKRFATVRHAALTAIGGRRYRLDLALAGRGPAHAWVSIAASVAAHGHVVEKAKPVQLGGAALAAGRAQLSLPRALSRGRYKLTVHLLETVTSGAAQASRTLARTITVIAR